MKSIVIGMLMVASILSANAVIIFDVTQSRMQELNIEFDEIMTESLDFLDHAWDVAKKFQDPNYDYDPSELGNYTTPENHTATASFKYVLCG